MNLQLLNKDFYHIAAGDCDLPTFLVEDVELMIVTRQNRCQI